jgi:hypothetical protein
VGGLDPAIVGSARLLDSGADGGAGLGGEAFEEGRDRPWARWFDAVGGELGGSPFKAGVIHRRPHRRQLLVGESAGQVIVTPGSSSPPLLPAAAATARRAWVYFSPVCAMRDRIARFDRWLRVMSAPALARPHASGHARR